MTEYIRKPLPNGGVTIGTPGAFAAVAKMRKDNILLMVAMGELPPEAVEW